MITKNKSEKITMLAIFLILINLTVFAGDPGVAELSSLAKDAQTWQPKHALLAGVKDGYMQIMVNSGSPMIFSPKISLEAKNEKIITFKMKVASGINGKGMIHFITDKNPNWSDNASVPFQVTGTGEITDYKVDMSVNPLWNDKVLQVRIMPYALGFNYKFASSGQKYIELGPGFTGMQPFVWTLEKYGIPFQTASSVIPVPYRKEDWRHPAFLQFMGKRNANAQVVFLGDSITQGWTYNHRCENGSKYWEKDFVPMNVQNFALAGDETQNLLWQITEGKALDGMKPKLFVIMIGINNILRGASVEDTVSGIETVLMVLRKTHPDAKILLLGLLPNKVEWDKNGIIASRTAQVNNIIKDDADNQHIFYFDSSKTFINKDGKLDVKLFIDGLHLNEKGYGKWADVLIPEVRKLTTK